MPFPSLISPEALAAGTLLLDARRGEALFVQGHLVGAQEADLDRFCSLALAPGTDPARGGRHPLPAPGPWARQMAAWGITPDTWVVAYDAAQGGDGAARLWWMLRASGHDRAAVLDGGLQGALAAGLPLATGPAAPVAPAPPHPNPAWAWPTVDLATVDRLRQDIAWKVLDVRSHPRFRGDTEPLDPVAGHIPGALNLPFTENLTPDGHFKSPATLRELYLNLLNGTPPSQLVVHCGSGVTACHTLLALDLAGLPGASLYVGSWSEWCRNPLPQAKGESANS